MSNYRRMRVPGGTYFFTVNLADPDDCTLCVEIDLLRECYRKTQSELPFRTDAIVVLPNHIHAIWTLPEGDTDYSDRWRRIKGRFSCALGRRASVSHSKVVKRERGIWQRRFWEHTIRNDEDLDRHLAYCWLDPVRHDLVDNAADWAFTSFNKRGETMPQAAVQEASFKPEMMGEICRSARPSQSQATHLADG